LKDKKCITQKDSAIIFNSWESLLSAAKQSLKDLEDKLLKDQEVGGVFQKMVDPYKAYCASLSNSLGKVEELKKVNNQFSLFLKDAQEDPRSRGLDLASFLMKPSQRSSKYPLLLGELLKNTGSNHPDYSLILFAKEQFDHLDEDIHRSRSKTTESEQLLIQIQEDVDGISNLVIPGRTLIQEGNLMVSTKDSKPKSQHIFLFNDLLLITKEKGKTRFQAVSHVPLVTARVIMCGDTETQKNAFQVTDEAKMFTFSASSTEERTLWFENMRNLLKHFQLQKMKVMGNSSSKLV